MITHTERAAVQAKAAAEQNDSTGLPLRLAVKSNEDGSFQYAMGFDNETEEDIVARSHGVKIVAKTGFAEQLNGMTIDFVELEPGNFQFIFMNPNDPSYVPPSE